jgi:hypothetical protein
MARLAEAEVILGHVSQTEQPPPESSAPLSESEAVPAGRLTVIATRGGDGLGVTVSIDGSRRIFRIEPARDPNQPRFWCLRIYRCTAAGVVAPGEQSWWGGGGMSRADLPAIIASIRVDPTTWLAGQEQQELRSWMMETGDA